jgi:Kef-type K+ transport system membrane component KefB
MIGFLSRLNSETQILLVLSIILFSGFIMTRLTNTLNMPKVSGYILAGILIGPYFLDLIPHEMITSLSFVSDLALAFIAFGVGKFFKKDVILQTGKKIVIITITEALAAGILTAVSLKLLFHLDWGFVLILGAIATATAPASTMMTINQYKAKGEFVDTLLQIVALDDVVCLLAFSIVSSVVGEKDSGMLSLSGILTPIALNLLFIILGIFCGYFLSRLLIPARSRDNRLILAIAMLLGISGLCAAVDISPLLSCMVFGAVYINLTKDKKLFRQINNFTPPIMSIFFIVSGMNLDVSALATVGSIGVCYFLIRIIGKYLGAYLSCFALKMNANIRNYIGLALIPQAGVAIGLAFLGQRLLPEETGNLLLTIILSSSVLYEMVGPISAKAALFLSGSIPRETIREGSADPELPAADDPDLAADDSELTAEVPDSAAGDADTLSYESVPEEAEASDASDAAPASDPPEISETSEAYSAAFPKLKEYNEGVDERDDDDIEAVPTLPKNRKKKKRKGKK